VGSGLAFDNFNTVTRLDTVRFYSNKMSEQSFSGRTFDNVEVFVPDQGP
jgi:hypothetical protein